MQVHSPGQSEREAMDRRAEVGTRLGKDLALTSDVLSAFFDGEESRGEDHEIVAAQGQRETRAER